MAAHASDCLRHNQQDMHHSHPAPQDRGVVLEAIILEEDSMKSEERCAHDANMATLERIMMQVRCALCRVAVGKHAGMNLGLGARQRDQCKYAV